MMDQLLAQIRKLAPVKVVVYDHADEKREIAVPTRRKKWSQVVDAIEARPWARVECLDKGGAVLGYIEQDDAPGELEDIGRGGGKVAETKAMLELFLRAQETALKYQDKDRSTLMQSMRELLEVNTLATRELVGLMRMQRDTALDIAEMRAAAPKDGEDAGDWDKLLKLLEESPKLMASLGPLVGTLMQMGRALKAPPAPAPRKPAPAAPATPAAEGK